MSETLPGTVARAAYGVLGFDADQSVASVAGAFYQQGYRFCVRYVSRDATSNSTDLSPAEGKAILDAGLALMVVQHVSSSGWQPSGDLGSQYGGHAAQNAAAAGLPAGVTVWCDLEGIDTSTAASDVIAYCNNWYAKVHAAGYRPGLYVGARAGLTGAQLYQNLRFASYWKGESRVPFVENRGYQMVQGAPRMVNGICVDVDLTCYDAMGDLPYWLQPAGFDPGTGC